MSARQTYRIVLPRLLDRRQFMTKTYRHIAMTVVFAFLVVFTTSIGFVEGGDGIYGAIIVLGTLLALILLFGVPVDYVSYGKFRIEFEHWGPTIGSHEEDEDDDS